MAMWTDEEVKELLMVASENNGKCDRCQRKISIYRYPINKQAAEVLRAMREEVERVGANEVNFSKLNLPYRLESQRTKMRLHGLIARVQKDGRKIRNTWLITTKGADFLSGEPIDKTVVVFDNQLLGHEGEKITVHSLNDDAGYAEEPIETKQAEVYSDLRTPKRQLEYYAVYRGYDTDKLKRGVGYNIKIDRLQVGHQVVLTEPISATYPDIAAFTKSWSITDAA